LPDSNFIGIQTFPLADLCQQLLCNYLSINKTIIFAGKSTRGAPILRAEIILIEPAPGNAGEGKRWLSFDLVSSIDFYF
jgi:hypothetical protein